jgi:hypothetical protein
MDMFNPPVRKILDPQLPITQLGPSSKFSDQEYEKVDGITLRMGQMWEKSLGSLQKLFLRFRFFRFLEMRANPLVLRVLMVFQTETPYPN